MPSRVPAHASGACTASRSLQSAGLRCTTARVCVWQALEAACGFVSADVLLRMLLDQGRFVGIGTVYRVLGLLESRGLVVRQRNAERKAFYRLKPQSGETPRLRFTCVVCRRSVCMQERGILDWLQRQCGDLGVAWAGEDIDIGVRCTECLPVERA